MPAGYNPDELLEWGKAPGLNVDILHKYGFTGEGAVIAYIDQPIAKHSEYSENNIHYTNNTDSADSMHGPAVLSLLAGKTTGTAPDAEVYFYGHASWKADQTTHAECLYQIIEQNKTLPEDNKIRMVAFSDGIDSSEANADAFRAAVKACEEAGVMVWFCQEYCGASFLPMSDKNDYTNLVPEQWYGDQTPSPGLVYVPASGRTSAATIGGASYIYWASGGLSWTMPYVFGLYAIAIEINPSLTQDELRTLIKDTAYDNNGMKIVNPVGFVSAVLKGVGRNTEAEAMEREAQARNKYIYAIMDTASLSEKDLEAIGSYLASITDATVLVADSSAFSSAGELYAELKSDARARGGSITGIQIFGTPDMVPAFEVQYKAQMINGVDESGLFLTDLFYGNFDNKVSDVAYGYNIMDHFANGWDIELVPDWPVVRLPLSKGEYSAFFEKYESFVSETGLEHQNIVNFSNPIFNQKNHIDDMGHFLNRAKNEFRILNVPYNLYGNLVGDVPVTTKVSGGFTAENLATENENGIAEFIINSHGQWNNIDKCYFENGKEIRESLVNMNTINSTLDDNPYYLDCWTCLNGSGMKNNLTTTALNGKCVGMFSATTVISNNGVSCFDSVSEMKQSNFYYFYYCYLKALNDGLGRSDAFFEAQRSYGEALIADSKNPLRGEGNYQFNLHNLLAYHNFGVIEPNQVINFFDAKGYIEQAGQSVPKDPIVNGRPNGGNPSSGPLITDGNPVGDAKTFTASVTNSFTEGELTVHSLSYQHLDNDHIRFTVEYTAPKNCNISVFSPPNGDVFMMIAINATTGEKQEHVFDISEENLRKTQHVTLKFYLSSNENEYSFVSFSTGLIR